MLNSDSYNSLEPWLFSRNVHIFHPNMVQDIHISIIIHLALSLCNYSFSRDLFFLFRLNFPFLSCNCNNDFFFSSFLSISTNYRVLWHRHWQQSLRIEETSTSIKSNESTSTWTSLANTQNDAIFSPKSVELFINNRTNKIREKVSKKHCKNKRNHQTAEAMECTRNKETVKHKPCVHCSSNSITSRK